MESGNWWDVVLNTGPNTNYDQFALSSWLVRRLETEPALYAKAVSSLDGYLQSLAYRKNRLLDDVVRVVGVIAARTGYGRDLASVLKHPRNWERTERFGSNATLRDAATTILLCGVMSDTERYHRTLVMLKAYTNPDSHKFTRFDLFDALAGTWFSPANNSYGGMAVIERRALYRPELRAAMYHHFFGCNPDDSGYLREDVKAEYVKKLSATQSRYQWERHEAGAAKTAVACQLLNPYGTLEEKVALERKVTKALQCGATFAYRVLDECANGATFAALSDVEALVASGIIACERIGQIASGLPRVITRARPLFII
jgi:hypothetical protein